MPVCNHCLQEKDEEEFNWRWKALGIRHPACRECIHKFNEKYFDGDVKERHKRNVRERDPRVLLFDHVHGKNSDLSRLIADGALVEKIKRELELCEIRCANCHQKKTMEERGWYKARK